jgi:hypothetical protein
MTEPHEGAPGSPEPQRKSLRDRIASGSGAVTAAVAAAGVERLFVPSGAPPVMWLVPAVLAVPWLVIAASFAVGSITGVPVPRRPSARQVRQMAAAGVVLAAAGWFLAPWVGQLWLAALDAWDPLGCHGPGGC